MITLPISARISDENWCSFLGCSNIEKIRLTKGSGIQQDFKVSAYKTSLYYGTATKKEKDLAKRIVEGEYYFPATNALWFYATNSNCKGTWYNQKLAGNYKKHCFYEPDFNICKKIH